jgi:hypothetical protein
MASNFDAAFIGIAILAVLLFIYAIYKAYEFSNSYQRSNNVNKRPQKRLSKRTQKPIK